MALGLGHDLRIKYGLSDDPSDELIIEWAARVANLTANGEGSDQAGRQAALEVFGELDKVLYFSAADTIEALLARAKEK